MADAEDERPATASIEVEVWRPTTVGGSFTQLPRENYDDFSDNAHERGQQTFVKYRPDEVPGLGLLDPDSGMMEIFVKTPSGKTITVAVEEEGEETLASLKGKIELQTGIPPDDQHLVFAGMPVEGKDGEERSLGEYGIRKGPATLTLFMVPKIEVSMSVHVVDMDDEEVVYENMKKDLEGVNVNLEWLLNSEENAEVLEYLEDGPDNVIVAKMKEMAGTLDSLVEQRTANQNKQVQLQKDIAKIAADKEDIIWHATRLCVEGPREDGLELRDRKVKVVPGTDEQPEAEWMKQWGLGTAAKSVVSHQKGGWNTFMDNYSRPKNDGRTIPGAKAAVIDLILSAEKKRGMGAKERKRLHAQLIDLTMSKVWARAIEVGVLEDKEALSQQDAERRRAHAILKNTNKEKDKIIAGLEGDIARAREIGTDRIESMEEQFRMLCQQRDRMCVLLGGAQDSLPLAITQAHKTRMKATVDNRSEFIAMTREFDIEKNARNKKAGEAIATVEEELNEEADRRAMTQRKEAYALAEKLSTDVTSSSELVTQRMREHGQGSERATETKRETEIRQETEHALAVRNNKLLKKIKDMVMYISVLEKDNAELAHAAKALGAAAEESAAPPPEQEAMTRIAMFEMQECMREVKTVKRLRKEIVMEKQKAQKRCARLRAELKKQAKYILMMSNQQANDTSMPSVRGAEGTPSTAPASRDRSSLKPSPPGAGGGGGGGGGRTSARMASGFRLPQLRGM